MIYDALFKASSETLLTIAASPPSVTARGANAEARTWFDDALALSRSAGDTHREAVVLRYVADLRHAEAAEVLGCSEEAARRILAACRRGDAEVLFPLPAKLAAVVNAVAPGLTTGVLATVDRLLPSADRERTGRWKGSDDNGD